MFPSLPPGSSTISGAIVTEHIVSARGHDRDTGEMAPKEKIGGAQEADYSLSTRGKNGCRKLQPNMVFGRAFG